MKTKFISVDPCILTTSQSPTRNLTAWLSWVSASSLMWNVAEPFAVGSLADSAVVSEVVQSQNNRCLSLAEEDSEAQSAAIVADSVVAEGEEAMVDGVEDSVVAAAAASVAVVTTTEAAGAGVDTAVVDSGVYCVSHSHNRD